MLAAPLTGGVLRLPGMGNLIGVKSADLSGAGRPTFRGMLELAGRAPGGSDHGDRTTRAIGSAIRMSSSDASDVG